MFVTVKPTGRAMLIEALSRSTISLAVVTAELSELHCSVRPTALGAAHGFLRCDARTSNKHVLVVTSN
jgi:hypothetical protein